MRNLQVPTIGGGILGVSQAAAREVFLRERVPETPAVWQPARAAYIADRARAAGEAGAPQSRRRKGGAEASGAKAVLEAINSTLKGVSTERLAAASGKDMEAVSSLILAQMDGRTSPVEGLAVLARFHEERVRSLPYLEETLNPLRGHDKQEEIVIQGLPEGVETVAAGESVFRHYTSREGLEPILKSAALWNGYLPYVQFSRRVYRKSFDDLTGIFLTFPGVSGDLVGVPEREYPEHVDVRLPAGLRLLKLESGILLFPLPSRTRDWVRDIYRRWTAGEDLSGDYRRMAERMDERGGPGPELALPVTIVGSSR